MGIRNLLLKAATIAGLTLGAASVGQASPAWEFASAGEQLHERTVGLRDGIHRQQQRDRHRIGLLRRSFNGQC